VERADPICIAYRADLEAVRITTDARRPSSKLRAKKLNTYNWNWAKVRWRPSIFMSRWACRLRLKVVDVRIERLSDISCYDIRREGLRCPEHDGPGLFCTSECASLRTAFARKWDEINGKRAGCAWEDNPWVFVTTFERVK
jgi:hypothetical protein